ncbi:multiple sugar transport system permease protein [Isoptericola sp. CG 20/1183]|uniref:Multiple sugar transport system permease protein n=1 Tax=Isoptericola halotolerans TaxID=300560 RepID=A0ABX5EK58_9MICO|nr:MULTISPECIES: sugar ABC transporter permease [Isoptericola]PRZ08696.1 multiple sugar transport system permease protein [Isoptericola halotolerans]PRZ10857.1 multiple sugar transport system permease protein [Isoptericola sp. CG 20/1183]
MTSTPTDVGSRGTLRGTAGTTPAVPPGGRRRRTPSPSQWAAVGFAAPLLVYLVLFYAYPLWRNIDLSVHDYTIRAFVQGDAEFVGLQNYVDVFSSATFPTALWNTLVFTFGSIAFQFTIGLALAVFFRSSFRLSGTLRAMFLVPWLLPLIVSASTWAWMLNSENGVVNSVITAFGGEQINWLTSPDTALLSVTIANIWLGIPFNLVILYSGLQNIPGEVYEAAALDGAGAWRQFWSVTFPLLRPVSAITILLGLIYTLKVVDVIWVMTTGGPGDSSTTLAIWSYREAFGTGQPDFSPAAAVGNLLIVIALVFGFLHLRLQHRQEASS